MAERWSILGPTKGGLDLYIANCKSLELIIFTEIDFQLICILIFFHLIENIFNFPSVKINILIQQRTEFVFLNKYYSLISLFFFVCVYANLN